MSEPGADERVRMLSVLVEDHPGVLTRVGGMIMRRGFNIQGLSVGPSDRAGRSRMTLSVHAGHAEADQVAKQLDKLIEVIEISDLTDEEVVEHELMLARVDVAPEAREGLLATVAARGGRLVGGGGTSLVFEVTGSPAQLESVLEVLRPHRLRDLARSGPVAIRSGSDDPLPSAKGEL